MPKKGIVRQGSFDGDLLDDEDKQQMILWMVFLHDIKLCELDRLFAEGDTAVIELYSLGKEKADFLFDIESEVLREGPFNSPPANVRKNNRNETLSFFMAVGAKSVEFEIK